jgi:1-acyl-sn-glycerol-3-phosphate acyltransferase
MMGWLERTIPGQSDAYRRLVLRIYAIVVPYVLGPGLKHLVKGLFYAALRRRDEKVEAFLDGSVVWGEQVQRITRTTLLRLNTISCPPKGHLILVNHVNELDFAFDCLVLRKPYLANQTIKKTYFAYWWMRAMGSQVFDPRSPRTISKSARAVIAGLEHRSFIVYPEGSNSYTEEIGALRKGMLKLAFEHRIPVYVVLKSGMTSFQQQQRGNVLGYYALGTVDPASFPTWMSFREHIHSLMKVEKAHLDERVCAAAVAAAAAREKNIELPASIGA